MAEYCLECFNEMNGTDYTEKDYVISDDLELCEGCGEYKNVVITRRKENGFITILRVILRIIFLPYLIYKYIKENK